MFFLRAMSPAGTVFLPCIDSNGHAGPGVPGVPAWLLIGPLLRNESRQAVKKVQVRDHATDGPFSAACCGASVIPLNAMKTSKVRAVRILGLGAEGSSALPSVARAVVELWSGGAAILLESLYAGDDEPLAARSIRRWCDRDRVDVVFTVGRSCHERADFAPEMTAGLLDRALPGVEERMYLAAARGRLDLLFRGRAGMRRGTLVVNLPARPARARAFVRFLGPVVGHAVEKARGSDRECVPAGVLR